MGKALSVFQEFQIALTKCKIPSFTLPKSHTNVSILRGIACFSAQLISAPNQSSFRSKICAVWPWQIAWHPWPCFGPAVFSCLGYPWYARLVIAKIFGNMVGVPHIHILFGVLIWDVLSPKLVAP